MTTAAQLTLVAAIMLLIVLPHRLPLERVSPTTAATVWLSALALRALAMTGFAVFMFVYLPRTELFHIVKGWCFHRVVPVLAEHLGLSGHTIADTAVVLPGLAMAASGIWLIAVMTRAMVALWVHLRRSAVRNGPLGSVVTAEPDFVVAATVLGPARIVVSETALSAMDPEEVRASVTHELGHIRRRHRPLFILAAAFAALARSLPGTRAARRGLALSLERDADEFSVAQTRDPLSLASAICKAATARNRLPSLAYLGGDGSVTTRLEALLEGGQRRGSALGERCVRGLAIVMVSATVLLFASLPGWAMAAPPHTSTPNRAISCAD